ncbi:hypothetical protein FGO68_gene13563 [Halteria grandinella]|uniref:Uncharacterized protein n=1 Tax=Halteria grandinella TaxID=5974 RepID=A0A8J8NCI5_HALGN|nr:hypothetical protein FGO68_gene13563 [Halteria grandinella]
MLLHRLVFSQQTNQFETATNATKEYHKRRYCQWNGQSQVLHTGRQTHLTRESCLQETGTNQQMHSQLKHMCRPRLTLVQLASTGAQNQRCTQQIKDVPSNSLTPVNNQQFRNHKQKKRIYGASGPSTAADWE